MDQEKEREIVYGHGKKKTLLGKNEFNLLPNRINIFG